MDPVKVPPAEPAGRQNDPLWASRWSWAGSHLEAARAALSAAERILADPPAVLTDVAGEIIALTSSAEHHLWLVRRSLRGESIDVLEDATGQGRR